MPCYCLTPQHGSNGLIHGVSCHGPTCVAVALAGHSWSPVHVKQRRKQQEEEEEREEHRQGEAAVRLEPLRLLCQGVLLRRAGTGPGHVSHSHLYPPTAATVLPGTQGYCWGLQVGGDGGHTVCKINLEMTGPLKL